jgi:hypothetical protein
MGCIVVILFLLVDLRIDFFASIAYKSFMAVLTTLSKSDLGLGH